MSHEAQVSSLASAVSAFASSNGSKVAAQMEEAARLLIAWCDHLDKFAKTGTADELLAATMAAVREAAALAALGAVRPCLFSMRAQIDLVLGWAYFRDHPVEYRIVCSTGDGFKLKSEVLKYLKESFPPYAGKIGALDQIATRQAIDAYRLLSAHIHAQSDHVLPKLDDLKDLIGELDLISQCVSIQADVSEYISDHLFSMGLVGVDSLPECIGKQIRSRAVSPGQLALLFA